MKPHEFLAALMCRDSLNSHSLAAAVRQKKLQPQIYRFSMGEVANPAASTTKPLADHFKVPMEAFYDEKVASDLARSLRLQPAPASFFEKRARTKPSAAAIPASLPDDVVAFARHLAKVTDEKTRAAMVKPWVRRIDAILERQEQDQAAPVPTPSLVRNP